MALPLLRTNDQVQAFIEAERTVAAVIPTTQPPRIEPSPPPPWRFPSHAVRVGNQEVRYLLHAGRVREQLVRTVRSLVGTRYLEPSELPQAHAAIAELDCSTTIRVACREVLNLVSPDWLCPWDSSGAGWSGTAVDYFRLEGITLNRDEVPEPGDLLIFERYFSKGLSPRYHVMMATGPNGMVGACPGSKRVAEYDTVDPDAHRFEQADALEGSGWVLAKRLKFPLSFEHRSSTSS